MDNFIEVFLRVPPLIFIDQVLATNFGMKKQSSFEFLRSQLDSFLTNKTDRLSSSSTSSPLYYNVSNELELEFNNNNNIKNINNNNNNNDSDSDTRSFLTVNLNLLVLYLSFMLFLFSSKHIKRFYLCLVSIGVLLASNYSNSFFISFLNSHHEEIDDKISFSNYKLIKASLISYISQLILVEVLYLITPSSSSALLLSSNDSSFLIKKHVSRVLFILPTVVGVLIPLPFVSLMENLSITITGIVCFDLLADWINFIKNVYEEVVKDFTWCKHVIKYNGLLHLLELQWTRLMIPKVLMTFWITKFLYQLSIIVYILVLNPVYFNSYTYVETTSSSSFVDYMICFKDLLLFIIKQLAIAGCETIICVSGMSSILCAILNKIGHLIQKFLIAIDDDQDRNLGKIGAILFFVLALQTGLTDISAELRFERLYRNLCLLLTANLYVIHGMVNPLLLQLSVSKNKSLNRHARPLIVCALLFIFPFWFVIFLWSHNQISTWLLAVSTFCIEIVIKVSLSLLVYALYMLDAYRTCILELDDYLFYIKSLQFLIQFLFSIFIFCNGAWILFYESGGAIRAMMISIHTYFNIWTQAKEGWKVFSKRRNALSKLDLLRDATPQQLSELNDVCAICYQELTSAKITLCNHYFHSTCLRKWFNVADQCPLCLQICFKPNEKAIKDQPSNDNAQVISDETNNELSTPLDQAEASLSLIE